MIIKHTYNQTDSDLFDGFYESCWTDADYFLDGYELPNNDVYFDIENKDKHFKECAEAATNTIFEELRDVSIIKSYKFKAIKSPRFYNFTTDKLIIDLEVDARALLTYCNKTESHAFKRYLQDNHASRSGYTSFINIIDFKDNDNANRLDIMIDFYLQNECNIDWIKDTNFEKSLDILHENVALYNCKTQTFYGYEITDQDTINII